MSNELSKLLKLLSSLNNKEELTNVSFFLGDDSNISQEDLCREASKALEEIRLEKAKSKDIVDSTIKTININDFLKNI